MTIIRSFQKYVCYLQPNSLPFNTILHRLNILQKIYFYFRKLLSLTLKILLGTYKFIITVDMVIIRYINVEGFFIKIKYNFK